MPHATTVSISTRGLTGSHLLAVGQITGVATPLTDVLLVANGSSLTVGAPLVAGASVTAKIVEHFKGEKVIIFKKRRRQNSRRKNGHRQLITMLEITGIKAGK